MTWQVLLADKPIENSSLVSVQVEVRRDGKVRYLPRLRTCGPRAA